MTDSNGVLSDYSFSSSDSNVSVSKSGNKLTISSTVAISGSVRITAKRNNVPTVSSSAKLIAYGDPNLQDLVTGVENADTVSAYINIETPTARLPSKRLLRTELWRASLLQSKVITLIKQLRQEHFELIEAQMRSAEGVTEELKRQNPMEWVRHCNNIRNRAAEIIKQELIYV